ncbi:uncharacterized protein LOC111340871 [Stylophora pistillata]|uniref:uncharacterized protein LOC111340871 n=1 Tax=Stylophora pistillata TaxID=50429 RepID=UPI000C03FE10|nr:uncharacterized protein LOC111340871 [Stylophora pistillata]
MKTRRSQASSPYSDSQYFWNGQLEQWMDLRANYIPEGQLPTCREKPSRQNFREADRLSNLCIDLRADLLTSWTDHDRANFIQRFTEVGKDFQLISNALPGKTVAQCIQHYYLTKHRCCYKNLRKKAINQNNGLQTRRVKSCGIHRANIQQRSAIRDIANVSAVKGKIRKTFSCPEPKIVEARETCKKRRKREAGASEVTIQRNKNANRRFRNTAGSPSEEENAGIYKDSERTTEGKSLKYVNRGKGVAKGSNTCGQVTSARADHMNNLQEPNRGKSKKRMRTNGQGNNHSTHRGKLGNEKERICVESSGLSQLGKANKTALKTMSERTNGALTLREIKNGRKLLKRKKADSLGKEFETKIHRRKGFKTDPAKVDHHVDMTAEVLCKDDKGNPKKRSSVKRKQMRPNTFVDEWSEVPDAAMPCGKNTRRKLSKRHYPLIKIKSKCRCPVKSTGENDDDFDKTTLCNMAEESHLEQRGEIMRNIELFKAGCNSTTNRKGGIAAKYGETYGQTWHDDDCVITCVKRRGDKERDGAIVESDVVGSSFAIPSTMEESFELNDGDNSHERSAERKIPANALNVFNKATLTSSRKERSWEKIEKGSKQPGVHKTGQITSFKENRTRLSLNVKTTREITTMTTKTKTSINRHMKLLNQRSVGRSRRVIQGIKRWRSSESADEKKYKVFVTKKRPAKGNETKLSEQGKSGKKEPRPLKIQRNKSWP